MDSRAQGLKQAAEKGLNSGEEQEKADRREALPHH
jgi:hypothetical protein